MITPANNKDQAQKYKIDCQSTAQCAETRKYSDTIKRQRDALYRPGFPIFTWITAKFLFMSQPSLQELD